MILTLYYKCVPFFTEFDASRFSLTDADNWRLNFFLGQPSERHFCSSFSSRVTNPIFYISLAQRDSFLLPSSLVLHESLLLLFTLTFNVAPLSLLWDSAGYVPGLPFLMGKANGFRS
jgi:hypothetical protein